MKLMTYLPMAMRVLSALSGVMGIGNAAQLGQSDGGLSVGSGLSYVAPWFLGAVASAYVSVKTEPNRDLRKLVDGLLASGDFAKAREMIQQWGGQ